MSVEKENNNKIITFHKVKQNETIEKIAKIYNILPLTLQNENNVKEVSAGDLIKIPNANNNIYVVQPVDNIFSIAKKLNVSVEHLRQKNKCNYFFIGQKILY